MHNCVISGLPEASKNHQINGCLVVHEGGQERRNKEYLKIELETKSVKCV